ncbi:MAG: hypothetical protein AAF577_04415 [Pseudomonadota bacterium]
MLHCSINCLICGLSKRSQTHIMRKGGIMFPSQMTAATEELRRWKKPTEDAVAFFLSFSPIAPIFGVDYRFAEYTKLELPTASTAKPAKPVKAKAPKAKSPAPVKPVTKAVAKAADKPATKAETPAAAPKPIAAKAKPKAAEPAVKAQPAPKPAPAPKPVEPAPTPAPAVAATAAPSPVAGGKPAVLATKAPAKPDDLKMIKGIGPALEKQLNGLGVYSFSQIAEMSEKDLSWVDDNLTAFKGRCFRDDWVGQAKAQLA